MRGSQFFILHQLFELVQPNIIFIQDTMVVGSSAREVLRKFLKGWYMSTIDAIGQSVGLLSAWNPRNLNVVPFFTPTGIMFEGYFCESDQMLRFINSYGPYADKNVYWQFVKNDGVLQ